MASYVLGLIFYPVNRRIRHFRHELFDELPCFPMVLLGKLERITVGKASIMHRLLKTGRVHNSTFVHEHVARSLDFRESLDLILCRAS